MTISKLLKVSGVLVTLFSVATLALLFYLYGSFHKSEQARKDQMEFGQLSSQLAGASDYLTNMARQYAVTGDRQFYDRYWKEVNETKTRDKVVNRLDELGATKEELALIEEAKQNSDSLVKLEEESMKAAEDGNLEKASELVFGKEYEQGKSVIGKPIFEFQEKIKNRSAAEADDAEKQAAVALFSTIGIIVLLIVTMLGSFGILFRKINKPIKTVSETLEQVAAGNLTVKPLEIKSEDEIGQLAKSLNKMTSELNSLIAHVANASHQVAASSQELSASAEQSTAATELLTTLAQSSSEGAEKQLNSINEIASGMTGMSARLGDIASSSTEMYSLSEEAADATANGSSLVSAIVTQMDDISEAVTDSSAVIRHLGKRSTEIGNIINVITDIANQTNLLALNAAIEAARAGEHGKGFAVVADEVRVLAESTKNSTEEIAKLIQDIQSETNKAIQSMDKGTERVSEGLKSAGLVNASFSEISRFMNDVSGKVGEVSTSIDHMAEETRKILSSLEAIQDISRANAEASQQSSASSQEQMASIEEINASSQALAGLADELQDTISAFKING